jgi:arsenate reductase
MNVTVYQYPACSTCRKALKWLDAHRISYEAVHIVDTPPTEALLRRALDRIPLEKLFNTSGQSYKAGNFKDKLPKMTEADALKALARDGKLLKRPFAVAGDTVLVGFDEAAWRDAL